MTEFEVKRLNYFIKEAEKYGWVHLSPADMELLQKVLDMIKKPQ